MPGNEKSANVADSKHDSKSSPSATTAQASVTAANGTAAANSDTKHSVTSAIATVQKVSVPSIDDGKKFRPAYFWLQSFVDHKDSAEQFRAEFESITLYRQNHPILAKMRYVLVPGTNFENDIIRLIDAAIERGRTDLLEIMRDHVIKFPYALHRAVFYQKLNVVRWLFDNIPLPIILKNCDEVDPNFIHRRKLITLARNVLGIACARSDTAHRSAGNKEIVALICLNIKSTYFSCEIGVLRLAVDFPEILVQLLNYFPRKIIEEFIVTDFEMSLCVILQKYSAEDIDKVCAAIDPFILAQGLKKVSFAQLLDQNGSLTPEQREKIRELDQPTAVELSKLEGSGCEFYELVDFKQIYPKLSAAAVLTATGGLAHTASAAAAADHEDTKHQPVDMTGATATQKKLTIL